MALLLGAIAVLDLRLLGLWRGTPVGALARATVPVAGAGLALATMDMIKPAGGAPAHFLDVGGGASPERVATAFRLVLSDRNVKAILVNIFAGINRCDWIAEGVVKAAREVKIEVPLVVRLAGTNVEAGKQILAESGLDLITADTLSEAAVKAVDACNNTKNH